MKYCDIGCDAGSKVCQSAIFNWSSNAGLDSLYCHQDGEHVCEGVTFPTPDPNTSLTIVCGAHANCAKATLICPDNADCTIICSAYHACQGISIYV